jgi:hypothetical protein
MYYSLTISDDKTSINTYDDWFIVPTSRPSFSPPSFEAHTIEIPGRNGLLDVTTAFTKFPTFGNRTGTFEFLIHPETPMTWHDTYSKIGNFIHGQTRKISLEDDPAYWYEGRFWLTDFKTGDHYSTITIEYSVEPYKKSKWSTIDDWEIDPFEFNEGVYIKDYFKDLESNSPDSWTQIFNSERFEHDKMQGIVGQAPTVPELIVEAFDNGLDVWFENDELGIIYQTHLENGSNTDSNIIFSMLNPYNGVRMAIKGIGKLSIKYNIASL